jgi:hypothetical protein
VISRDYGVKATRRANKLPWIDVFSGAVSDSRQKALRLDPAPGQHESIAQLHPAGGSMVSRSLVKLNIGVPGFARVKS